MLTVRYIFLAVIISTAISAQSFADDLLDIGRAAAIDSMLENAVRRSLISGGIVSVGNSKGQLYSSAQGRLYPHSNAPLLSDRTLFDTASLTKVLATAPAVMKLLEQGKINLLDPLTRWFPEFEESERDEITLLSLLTHTSALDDVAIATDNPLRSLIEKAIAQNNGFQPGNRFRYADINFILLGELVRRASGIPLDLFCKEYIYAPAGMADTMFLPRFDSITIAPTADHNNVLTAGTVQDINARRLGGVAGHAGLFSTIGDLNRFATMILNHGKVNGSNILKDRVITQMTSPYFYNNGKIIRGLGWDISSPFSSPRGNSFSDMSFGHTGFSGSSIWIDPELDLYIILLTVRLDYTKTRLFNQLRGDISSLAVTIFANTRNDNDTANELKSPETLIP